MKKYILALLAVVAIATTASAQTLSPQVIRVTDDLYSSSTFAPSKTQDRMQMAQAVDSTQINTSAPVTSTTVVKGGNLAAQVVEWLQAAFGLALGTLLTALVYRGLGWMGIQVTDQQKSQLQGVIVNGLNDAAAKAATSLRDSSTMDINVKNQIVADAVDYTQRHAADTIKALGLDPKSGEAVEAIRARIQTALNDPATPTPPSITPATGQAA